LGCGRPAPRERFANCRDLHRLIGRAGRLEPSRAAAIVAQLAAGLDAAHASGLVHRDVKPANVLLTGTEDHVYLTDFGLTVEISADSRMTTTGHWIGSVDYMSPERLRAEPVDARTDVYALGGVLYAALTGEAPFRRQTVPQTIAAHLGDAPPPVVARPAPRVAPTRRADADVVAPISPRSPAANGAARRGRTPEAAPPGAPPPRAPSPCAPADRAGDRRSLRRGGGDRGGRDACGLRAPRSALGVAEQRRDPRRRAGLRGRIW